MSDRSKELTAAIKKLAADLDTSARVAGALRKHALIQPQDRTKEKWLRTVYAFPWEGDSGAVLHVAWWIAEMMDWKEGVLSTCNSSGDLSACSRLPLSTVKDAVVTIIEKGLLVAPKRGPRQRGALLVPDSIKSLEPGQCYSEHLSDRLLNVVNHLKSSGRLVGQICDDLAGGSASLAGGPATYPSLPSPVNEEACQQQGSSSSRDVDQTPTTEGSLTSLPHITSLPANNLNRAPRPPVASTTVKTHVAPATTSPRVAEASDTYGYGTEIAGLNGSTSEVVDQIVAMGGGIVLDKTPAWTAVLKAVRQTSPRRVRAAILDLQAKKVAGKLEGRPEHALAAFARRISEEDAAAKLEAAAAKPKFRLIDHMSGGHRR